MLHGFILFSTSSMVFLLNLAPWRAFLDEYVFQQLKGLVAQAISVPQLSIEEIFDVFPSHQADNLSQMDLFLFGEVHPSKSVALTNFQGARQLMVPGSLLLLEGFSKEESSGSCLLEIIEQFQRKSYYKPSRPLNEEGWEQLAVLGDAYKASVWDKTRCFGWDMPGEMVNAIAALSPSLHISTKLRNEKLIEHLRENEGKKIFVMAGAYHLPMWRDKKLMSTAQLERYQNSTQSLASYIKDKKFAILIPKNMDELAQKDELAEQLFFCLFHNAPAGIATFLVGALTYFYYPQPTR